MVIESVAELEQEIMKQTHQFLEESADDLINEIKQGIDEEVYDYNPKRYERTESLKDTLKLSQNKGKNNYNNTNAKITIDHNKRKSQWTSVKTGRRFYGVPEVVSYGKYGIFIGRGADDKNHCIEPYEPYNTNWAQPRDYMGYVESHLGADGYLKKCLKQHLPYYVKII